MLYFHTICHRDAIVNQGSLEEDLKQLCTENPDPDSLRPLLTKRLKDALHQGRQEIRHRFETLPASAFSGIECSAEQCFLMDVLLRALFQCVPQTESFCLIATGGYGRGELAPYSDIDLLFLGENNQDAEQTSQYILYILWDLGLKIGHATRTISQTVQDSLSNIIVRTSLLETRYIAGKRSLFLQLRHRLDKKIFCTKKLDFLTALLKERDERHLKMGKSRYLLEPNIKECKGGLRDLHYLQWMAKHCCNAQRFQQLLEKNILNNKEIGLFIKSHAFLWRVRCHLHYLAGRANEQLTFEMQREISTNLSYADRQGVSAIERFMKHYFIVAQNVGDLTHILCAAIEDDYPSFSTLGSRILHLEKRTRKEGFPLRQQRLDIPESEHFEKNPVDIIRIFSVADRYGYDIHPNACRQLKRLPMQKIVTLREDQHANALFLDILISDNNSEYILRKMNGVGVLGRFIPEFGRIVNQMQYNIYHHYTVDEHTIFAVGIAHNLEAESGTPWKPASEAMSRIALRRALYLALFCHDIAKGRKEDHSLLGAKIVQGMGMRFRLTQEETETAAWLVRHHLLMSHMAFERNWQDTGILQKFVLEIQSLERLRLLFVLTTADIMATGEQQWTAWKADLLERLYRSAYDLLSGGTSFHAQEHPIAQAQNQARQHLPQWSKETFDHFVEQCPPEFWLSFTKDDLIRHMEFIHQKKSIGLRHEKNFLELSVFRPKAPRLFATIAGTVSLTNAHIREAYINSFANNMAFNVFKIESHDDKKTGDFLLNLLQKTLEDDFDVAQKLEQESARFTISKAPSFHITPNVVIDNKISETYTLIEIQTQDYKGTLYHITSCIANLGLTVSAAKIVTYGEHVVDVFYVQDDQNKKITAPHDDIKQVLMNTLTTLLESRS